MTKVAKARALTVGAYFLLGVLFAICTYEIGLLLGRTLVTSALAGQGAAVTQFIAWLAVVLFGMLCIGLIIREAMHTYMRSHCNQ